MQNTTKYLIYQMNFIIKIIGGNTKTQILINFDITPPKLFYGKNNTHSLYSIYNFCETPWKVFFRDFRRLSLIPKSSSKPNFLAFLTLL